MRYVVVQERRQQMFRSKEVRTITGLIQHEGHTLYFDTYEEAEGEATRRLSQENPQSVAGGWVSYDVWAEEDYLNEEKKLLKKQ